MIEFPVIPSRMALVNVDMQNVFVERSGPDGLIVLERINHLARVCRETGIAVFGKDHGCTLGWANNF